MYIAVHATARVMAWSHVRQHATNNEHEDMWW